MRQADFAGTTLEFPDGTPDAVIEQTVKRLASEKSGPTAAPTRSGGFLPRPGELTKAQEAVHPGRTALEVMAHPEGAFETVASALATAPLFGGAGTAAQLARLPAAVGRIGLAGGLGAGRAAMEGQSPGWHALLDAAVAAFTEGALTTAGAAAGKVGATAKAFKDAPGKIADAFEAIRARLPKGKWLNVPALSEGKLSPQEAIEKLSGLVGQPSYGQARDELASELSRFDMQRLTGPRPLAGEVFQSRTPANVETPGAFSRVAEGIRGGVSSDVGRSVADAAATTPVMGLPAGGMPALAAGGMNPMAVLRSLMQAGGGL